MCGIAGLLFENGVEAGRIGAMTDALVHRGPDASGIWTGARVALGHRRLAIQDLSVAGAQPMHDAGGRFVLAYNGECYNAPELRRMLEEAGAVFRGHSDTEVILEGFARWGLEPTLERMVGMFALALWDRNAEELTLVRDRMGIKPLYWRDEPLALSFASELKGLLAGVPEPPLSADGLAAYFRRGWLSAPLTIYQGVWQLPPGHLLRVRPGQTPRVEAWWSLGAVLDGIRPRDRVSDPVEARALIEETLGTAVRQRLLADVPLGAFLSGGIDSSLVTALMVEQAGGPVSSYAIGSPDPAYDEAGAAAEVAARLGTRHRTLAVDAADCLAEIPRLAETWDEPFADSSAVPTSVLCRLARKHVTVALSGDGGDEMFAGYNRHRWAARLAEQSPRQTRAMRMAAAMAGVVPDRMTEAVTRPLGLAGVARRLPKLGQMLDADGIEGMHDAALTLWPLGQAPAYGTLAHRFAPAERMQALDCLSYLPGDILTKVDRASMAVALEVRVPFLDHRVVEAAFRIAPALKLAGGTTKWLLRQMLYDRVPRALVDRPKKGFAIPLEHWLRGPLRAWAEPLIHETDWISLDIDSAPFRRAWRRHQSGMGDATDQLWAVLMLAAWLRRPRRPAG